MRAKKFFFFLAIYAFSLTVNPSGLVFSQVSVQKSSAPTLSLLVDGVIGPATLDYLQRAKAYCAQVKCPSLLLQINTPGGSLQSTRLIVEEILSSPVPVLCFIAPQGARAGSAGAIVMLACHVSGALKTTNIGAATPVSGGGAEIPEDLRNKLIEDTKSWVKSLSELRGRSQEFAEKIVTEARALSASEAQRVRAIDFVGDTLEEFLEFARGREVAISESLRAVVDVGPVNEFGQDLRYHVLDQLTDPQVAYMMLMGSLGLLYFELTHPGAIVPGVVGGVGLLISLVSLHKLDVWWGGLLLMILGMILLVAEAFTPSFGFLGFGGFVSFLLGSIFLYNPMSTGYVLPLGFLLPVLLIFIVAVIGVAYLALQSRTVRKSTGASSLEGQRGEVISVENLTGKKGQGRVQGELWQIESKQKLQPGEAFQVLKVEGLVLKVEPSADAVKE